MVSINILSGIDFVIRKIKTKLTITMLEGELIISKHQIKTTSGFSFDIGKTN